MNDLVTTVERNLDVSDANDKVRYNLDRAEEVGDFANWLGVR